MLGCISHSQVNIFVKDFKFNGWEIFNLIGKRFFMDNPHCPNK